MERKRMSPGSLWKLTQGDLPTLVIQHEKLLKAHILSHIIFRLEDCQVLQLKFWHVKTLNNTRKSGLRNTEPCWKESLNKVQRKEAKGQCEQDYRRYYKKLRKWKGSWSRKIIEGKGSHKITTEPSFLCISCYWLHVQCSKIAFLWLSGCHTLWDAVNAKV